MNDFNWWHSKESAEMVQLARKRKDPTVDWAEPLIFNALRDDKESDPLAAIALDIPTPTKRQVLNAQKETDKLWKELTEDV